MNLQKYMQHFLRSSIAITTALVFSSSAFGDELQDVRNLVKEGKLTDALMRANRALEKQQADPAMQFTKGLILSEQKKTTEAIAVFSRLTTEHPDYPEPYNNLAVLFATEGNYAKARVALETALKLNPKYVTAQENLGDVYLQSALQSYSDATKGDADSAGLKAKLKSVRQTLGVGTADASAVVPKGTGATVVSALGANDLGGEPDVQKERALVLGAVNQWVKAWSAKDLNTYFSLYAEDFRPATGESRSKWQRARRARINGKEQIDIQVLSPSVTVEDKVATVNFQQIYIAGKVTSNARKILTLKNQGGAWKITQEKSEG